MTNPAEPPFKQGDWITAAFHYRPTSNIVWQATATPERTARTGSGWAVFDSEGPIDASNFRQATREDIAAEIERVIGQIETLNERRQALEDWYVKTEKTK